MRIHRGVAVAAASTLLAAGMVAASQVPAVADPQLTYRYAYTVSTGTSESGCWAEWEAWTDPTDTGQWRAWDRFKKSSGCHQLDPAPSGGFEWGFNVSEAHIDSGS